MRRAVAPASGAIAQAPRARRRWPTGRARGTSARASPSPSPAAEHSTPRFKSIAHGGSPGCACACLPLSLDPRCLLRLSLLLSLRLLCRSLLHRRMLFCRPPRCRLLHCPLRCLLRCLLRCPLRCCMLRFGMLRCPLRCCMLRFPRLILRSVRQSAGAGTARTIRSISPRKPQSDQRHTAQERAQQCHPRDLA